MTVLATPLLEVEKIEITEGMNPRTHMNKDALARLARSLDKTDVVQPIAVRPMGGGKFALIAGHRRLAAAKLAGIEKVPVHIREGGNPRTAALAENFHRENLDPIDTARGLKELGEELNLTTNRKIAEELDVSEGWVSQHLRLLKLPEAIHPYIAQSNVPIEAERDLRRVAEVSPQIAECVCQLAKRNKVKGREFVINFGELLEATAQACFENPPTMIDPGVAHLSEAVGDARKRRDLGDRYRAARPYDRAEDPALRFQDAEVDAARAAGCLVEHRIDNGEWTSTVAFICDRDLAADLAERAIERIEKEAAERKRQEEEWRTSGAGGDSDLTPEGKKEARRTQREEAKERAMLARSWNEKVGHNLLKRRGGRSRTQHALARAKALAAVVIADNPTLAARGFRLVATQLQEVEVKQLKTTGESREKVSYAEPEHCTAYLRKRVEDAGSVNEVLEILGDALIASLLADEEELPQSRRVCSGLHAGLEVRKLLGADIKSIRPRRQRRKSGK
jgi:ParB/RepB/Spo0J family partition protein